MIDPRDDKPDRSTQYRETDPVKLRDQLNENWRQLRMLRAALADRDEVIATLHNSIAKRDDVIQAQAKSIKLRNRAWAVIYAGIGGAAASLATLGGQAFVKLILGGVK